MIMQKYHVMEDTEMIDSGSERKSEVTILDVLEVDLCREAILDHVHIRDIVRLERVCRRWQRAVLDYLPRCRNLTLSLYQQRSGVFDSHRTIIISDYDTFPVRNVLEKLGLLIVNLYSNRSDEEFYQHVTEFCPRLRQLELKQLSMQGSNISEEILGRAFENIQLEKLKLVRCNDLSGKCLQLMNLNRLKSLTFFICLDFRSRHLESNAFNLRNVTSLEIFSIYYFRDMIPLMENMPKLENLTYKGSFDTHQLVECCSRLDHLKRVHLIEHCDYAIPNDYEVDDDVLEGLARGCNKLEYLNIPGSLKIPYVRGLAALVLRSSPGTSVCFARVRSDDEDQQALLEYLQPLNNELKSHGRLQITQEMLNQAFKLKGQRDQLELRLAYPAPRNAKFHPDLKVVLNVFLDRISHAP